MKDNRLKVKAIIDRNLRDIISKLAQDNMIFVSINSIEITSDYSIAKVYLSFFSKDSKKSFDKLNKFVPYVRHELSQKISLYKTPEIEFIDDQRFIIDENMDELLKEDRKDLNKIKNKK